MERARELAFFGFAGGGTFGDVKVVSQVEMHGLAMGAGFHTIEGPVDFELGSVYL